MTDQATIAIGNVVDGLALEPIRPVGKISNNYFDGLAVTGVHKALFFIIMGAYFFEQLDNWNFGFIAPALAQSWNLQMTDIATFVFWYFVAVTTGGFLGESFPTYRQAQDLSWRHPRFFHSLGGDRLYDNFVVFTIFRALTG